VAVPTLVSWFRAFEVRDCGFPLVVTPDWFPSASSCQDWVAVGVATLSSVPPLLPEAERTPCAKPVRRPSASYAVLLSPDSVLLAWYSSLSAVSTRFAW
jgi:hypothetical protein